MLKINLGSSQLHFQILLKMHSGNSKKKSFHDFIDHKTKKVAKKGQERMKQFIEAKIEFFFSLSLSLSPQSKLLRFSPAV